jgi:hypothetical protein
VDAWRALSSGYRVETVEDCVIETQTGFQRRRREQAVDKVALEASLAAPPHRPATKELAILAVQAPDIVLDPGERALWAHALTRNDEWILCGPDKASLRFGVRVGFVDRLAALQTLLDEIGHRPKEPLRRNYTAQWHAQARHEIFMSEGVKRP